jgi:hypothetical protein
MSLSDQLARLADRAKQAEIRAEAAHTKRKADLESDVSAARASAEAQADKLRQTAESGEAQVSDWWGDVQKSWSGHIAAVRKNIDEKKAKHDAAEAERTAEFAEGDAQYAIDYAYAAVEEAEYAVLDAELARMDADELAAGHATA